MNRTIVSILVVLAIIVGAYLIFKDNPADTNNNDTASTQGESNMLANPLQAADGEDKEATLTEEEQRQAEMIQAEGK